MKKILSLILAIAMIMTIFCVVPVSAEDTPSSDTSKVYFYDDFSTDENISDFVIVPKAGSQIPVIEHTEDTGYEGKGAMKITYNYDDVTGPYSSFRMTFFHPSASNVNVGLPRGASVKLTGKVYFETSLTGGASFTAYANPAGSSAWQSGKTFSSPVTTSTWHDFNINIGTVTKTDGSATSCDFRFPSNVAAAGGDVVMYLDNLELKVVMNDAQDGNANRNVPTITGATATTAADGTLNLSYTYTETGSDSSELDSSVIKVFDGTTFLGMYHAGETFVIPSYNKISTSLKAVITPISGWGYLNGTDVTVPITPTVAESVNTSKEYFFTNLNTGLDGVATYSGNGNGAYEYAADKGIGGSGAIKISVDSGKYTDLSLKGVLTGDGYRTAYLPVGAKVQLKAKVKFDTTPASGGAAFAFAGTTNNGGNAWGSGTTIPAATATTQWHTITLTSQERKTTAGNTTLEFRMTNNSASANGGRHVFYLDDIEFKILYKESAELAAPTITDARAAAAADGSLYVEYTCSSNGTTPSTLDNSVIKVYDGDVCLGTTKKGAAFVVPAERRESANLNVAITPISGWRYIGTTDVTCAVGTRNGYYDYIDEVVDTATTAGKQIATSINNATEGSTVVLKAVCDSTPADAKVMIYEGATKLAESALTASSAVEVSATLVEDAANLKFYVGGAEGAFTLDDVEIKVLKDTTGVENSLPTVSNVSVLVDKETGAVTADYDYAESGSLAKGDNSVIKVYDGDVCLGAFVLGDSFTVPTENKTSGNLGIKVVPISLWGYFDDEVSALIPFCINPEITWAGDTASATVEITVNDITHELNSAEIIAILAVYDSEGIMVAAPSIATIGASDSHVQTLELLGIANETAAVAKVFVWKGTSLDDAGTEIYSSAIASEKE